MTTRELLELALSLPVEERLLLADSILKSVNAPDSLIDVSWVEEAKRRLAELRSGKVRSIPARSVLDAIYERHVR
jgi:hypothetical protein